MIRVISGHYIQPSRETQEEGQPGWWADPKEMGLGTRPQSKSLPSSAPKQKKHLNKEVKTRKSETCLKRIIHRKSGGVQNILGGGMMQQIRPQSLESELVQIAILSLTGASGPVLEAP